MTLVYLMLDALGLNVGGSHIMENHKHTKTRSILKAINDNRAVPISKFEKFQNMVRDFLRKGDR